MSQPLNSRAGQTVGFIAFVALFVSELVFASAHLESIEPWLIALLGFAAFRSGIALAEDEVFVWFRTPFRVTSKDATGAGDSVSPRHPGGVFGAIGRGLACPISARPPMSPGRC